MTRTPFAAALIAGVLLRAASLLLPGTRDLNVWKIWSFSATMRGVTTLYGVGGSPPERRVLDFHGAQTIVDYPPLALYELDLVGHLYRAAMGRRFPDTLALTATLKGATVLAEAAFALLAFVVIGRSGGVNTARWSVAAFWCNPASILDASALGYLDPLFIVPASGALMAAVAGWPALAGGLVTAAALTKAQAIVIAPAVAVIVWNAGELDGRASRLISAAAGAMVTAAIIVAPFVVAGAFPNMIGALQSLTRHDMLSANACNLWWLVGYGMRGWYSMADMGAWAAFTTPTRILQISRVLELGYPNPRVIGALLTMGAAAWALWTARRARDLSMAAALAAFQVHAYATLSAQVHENHLYAAVPLLAIASAGRRRYVPLLIVVSAIFTLNLNLFYGISEDIGYALPRTWTIIDATVVLSVINCAALWWHATILRGECSTAVALLRASAPA